MAARDLEVKRLWLGQRAAELRQKFCYPGGGEERGGNDTLRQKGVLPWLGWTKP
jgi:hypothetical protein